MQEAAAAAALRFTPWASATDRVRVHGLWMFGATSWRSWLERPSVECRGKCCSREVSIRAHVALRNVNAIKRLA